LDADDRIRDLVHHDPIMVVHPRRARLFEGFAYGSGLLLRHLSLPVGSVSFQRAPLTENGSRFIRLVLSLPMA
jgi:hypothetical protein